MYINAIEVLLYTPTTLMSYHEELEKFIIEKLETSKDIKVSELSKDIQMEL